MGVFMIIREECIIKNKLQLLLELIRVHERFATLAEKEYDDTYIAEEADEVLMCMGLELEHEPSKSMRLSDIIIGELLCMHEKLSNEIEAGDKEIHYNVKYYDATVWDIEEEHWTIDL